MSTSKDQQIANLLKQKIKSSPELSALPKSVRSTLFGVVDAQANSYSSTLINKVDGETNFQLNNIPNNLVGPNNPLDLVSSNLNPNQFKNNILPDVENSTLPQLSSELTNKIFNEFKNQLPAGKLNSLNLNSLFGSLSTSAGSAVSSGLNEVVGDFSNKLFGGGFTVPPMIEGTTSFFEKTPDPARALEQIDEEYSGIVSTQALNEARNFDIKSEENQEKLVTQTTGFIDPTATHPTKQYSNQSEVNKLARGDVKDTIVQKKEKTRTKGIKLPNEDSWEQPPIPFNGKYPYNKVYQTESGHVVEFDDTPGCERIQIYHRTGTFVEIDSNGNIVKRTVGSSYELIDKNGYISVTGDASVSVRGSVKVYVGGDADIEVEGDVNVKSFNDITMQAAGRVDISATEEINLHSANINIEADVNLSLRGDINAFLHSTDIYHKANNNIYTEVLNNNYLYVDKKAFVQTGDVYHVKSGSTIYNQANGDYNIVASNNINQDGTAIYFNSGTSSPAFDSLKSKYSYSANIGLIGTRKDMVYETIPNPLTGNYLDNAGYQAEDSETVEEAEKQKQRTQSLGISKQEDFDQPTVELEKKSPVSPNGTVIVPSDFVLQQTYLPDNYQLSKHFTLAMLSSKAAVSQYKVQPQLGLSYGQLVYNLQGIALNILEPILAMYPNMLVTSAFRTAGSSSTTSDHPRGKAVDIQFRNVSKANYYEIANKLASNLNYDKLLLEYKTYGTGMPWIHISFDVEKQRKMVLTYLNDKKYAEGLSNLA